MSAGRQAGRQTRRDRHSARRPAHIMRLAGRQSIRQSDWQRLSGKQEGGYWHTFSQARMQGEPCMEGGRENLACRQAG
jgi:hypothetical protein